MISTHLQKLAECEVSFKNLNKKSPRRFVQMYQTFQPTYLVAAKLYNTINGINNLVIDMGFNALNTPLPTEQELSTQTKEIVDLIKRTHDLADKIEVVANRLRSKAGGSLIPHFVKYNLKR